VLCPPDVAAGLRQLGRKDLPPLLEQEPVIQQDGGAWFFERRGLRFDVPIIGRHNAENAFMAVQACERLGLDLAAVRDALRTFKGIHRRLERIGQGKIAVFDDYAHNPAKIAASWSAVAEVAPRVIGFWRPHGFAPLSLMMNDLAGAFAGVFRPDDRLYILPVFYAGGTASKTVNAQDLVLQLNRLRVQSEALEGYGALRDRLLALARPGDAILGMGARDPELPLFARRIAEELKQRI
jgi:UDP-N-acetylmuramate--alanine ligase